MKAKFKEGDKVKVTASREELSSYNINGCKVIEKEGIIDTVLPAKQTEPFPSYIVEVEGVGVNFAYKESFLEKVEGEKTFPRMMIVSDDENFSISPVIKKEVLTYLEGHEYPYITNDDEGGTFYGYKFAKEIEENTIVKVIDGGRGARCANKFIGRVCSKDEAKRFKKDGFYLGGMRMEDEAIFIVNEKGCYGVNVEAELKIIS